MVSEQDITVFAETNYRDQCRLFGVKRDDRRKHMYIIGKTGMGKTNLLEQLIYSDIQSGHGLCLIDPHGDIAERILDYIPANRINDTIYFNPADATNPIGFNVLEVTNPETKHLIASGLVGVFKKIWADSWGPRLEYVLRNAILALLDYPGSTLLGSLRILTDKTYRKKVIEKIQDPVVKSFWVDEFAKYPDRFMAEAIAPIQNKVGQFLSNALIRNVVGQVKSSIDIRDVMDKEKILILNLSKGRIGEDTSGLLGAMMITQFQLAAMSRVDIPEDERKDFYLYVDEFQNFATESFANILSEARKYRLNLIIAHQYIEQLDEKVKFAVFGNVGTIICFRVGAADAEELVKDFAPYFTEEDLVNLAKWQVYLKLMIDGVASTPFSANVLPPITINFGNREKVIKVTRERYSMDRRIIEEKIMKWASGLENEAIEEHKAASVMPPRSDRRPPDRFPDKAPRRSEQSSDLPRPMAIVKPVTEFKPITSLNRPIHNAAPPKVVMSSPRIELPKEAAVLNKTPLKYEAICDRCGKSTQISFQPDGKRPVYCKDCLSIVRSENAKSKEDRDKEFLKIKQRLESTAQIKKPPTKEDNNLYEARPGEDIVL
jgi:CxxC-x17-CxxC domain-containing protein